jgi:hypothetical protein
MSSKELVISSNRHETRLAIMEDDQLVEVYFQRSNEYSLAGSIHKGRVTRVLPGCSRPSWTWDSNATPSSMFRTSTKNIPKISTR